MFIKNKKLQETLIYFVVVTAVLVSFIFQINADPQDSIFFTLIYLVIFFSVSELISYNTGILATTLVGLLQLIKLGSQSTVDPRIHFLIIAIQISFTIYYFIIKKLLKAKIEKTSAREKYYRNLVNMSLQPMIIKDKDGQVLFASRSIESLIGIKINNLIDQKIINMIHHDDLPAYQNFLNELIESPNEKKSVEFRLKKDDGWIWTRNDAVNMLDHKDIKAIVSSLQDITTQKTIDTQKTELLENEKNARTMAEKAIRDRDEFLSIASHELKTPLTTVLLQLQATLRKISTQSLADFSGGELLKSLQIAERQSQSLSVLIKDLLNVSLASTGRLTLNKESLNLSELVELLPLKYEEEIKISQCVVLTEVNDKQIMGKWDKVRIEQALTNLFMNALRHAKGSKIILSVSKDDQWAIFKIKDKGKGIPLDQQAQIFEPFKSASNSTKGLGIGLFITKQIIEAHSGQISLKSSLGKGSTFTVKLPLLIPIV